ncbi:MAG: lysophospholipid acyltransferase family protein [Thermoguttaceae bacterium]
MNVRLTAAILYRMRYTGTENIPREGGVVLAANHQSHLDPPLISAGPPRRMNFLARKTLYGFTPFALLIRSFDAIPIDLDGSPMEGLRESIRRLKQGEMLLVFPEGSRTADGRVGPFESGIGVLARHSKATIVPTAIEGAFDVWPKSRPYPHLRLGRVEVQFGPPLLAEEIRRYRETELVAEIEKRVRTCHAVLAGRLKNSRRRHTARG